MQTNQEILIVDDEVTLAQMVAETLEEEGYHIHVCHDGSTALLHILKHRPALVLLDVAMPVMMGSDLLYYLRRHGYQDLPIVVMTASLHPERYLEYGANAVLSKPFEIDTLLDHVARNLYFAS